MQEKDHLSVPNLGEAFACCQQFRTLGDSFQVDTFPPDAQTFHITSWHNTARCNAAEEKSRQSFGKNREFSP